MIHNSFSTTTTKNFYSSVKNWHLKVVKTTMSAAVLCPAVLISDITNNVHPPPPTHTHTYKQTLSHHLLPQPVSPWHLPAHPVSPSAQPLQRWVAASWAPPRGKSSRTSPWLWPTCTASGQRWTRGRWSLAGSLIGRSTGRSSSEHGRWCCHGQSWWAASGSSDRLEVKNGNVNFKQCISILMGYTVVVDFLFLFCFFFFGGGGWGSNLL